MNTVTTKKIVERAASVRPGGPDRFTRVVLVVLTLVFCLAMLEVGLRIIGRYQLDSVEGYFAAEGISYGLKKNVSKRVFWPTASFLVETDEFGFRFRKTGQRDIEGKPYYAVIGSSDAFGNGLDYDQTYVGVFAQAMAAHQIQVLNLAVGGHHLIEQAHRFKAFAATVRTAPTTVIIALNPLMISAYDDTDPSTIVRRGQLFDKDRWRLALAKMILANTSAAYCFFRDGIRNIQLRYFSRADFSLDFYVQAYSKRLPIRNPEKAADFDRRMSELESHIRGLGATPVCMYVPASGGFLLNKLKAEGKLDGSTFDTEFYEDLARTQCTAAGVRFVTLQPLLQGMYDRGEKLNFDLDAHFNGPTSQAVGEFLYESLRPESTTE